jgi:hypothetical protein
MSNPHTGHGHTGPRSKPDFGWSTEILCGLVSQVMVIMDVIIELITRVLILFQIFHSIFRGTFQWQRVKKYTNYNEYENVSKIF